ncbi:MAG: ABC transporter permease [Fuerstiella sp.]
MNGTIVVAERELPALLRTRSAFWSLVCVSVVFAVTVLLKWPESGVADLSGTQPRAAFRSLALAMLLAVVLVVPAFPATGIVNEVRRRTMELLLNSPLQRFEIFLGKALALLGFAVLLLLVTFPALACCYAMGGISLLHDVAALYALILVVCAQLIVVGLLVGTCAGSPESALRWGYGATFGLVFATLIPWQFLQGFEGWLGSGAAFLRQLSPVPALLQLVGDHSMNTVGLAETQHLMSSYLFYAAILIIAGGAVCVHRLNYSLLDRSRSQGIITDDRSLGARSVRRVFFLVDPQRRKAGIPGYLNPVLVKEFRSRQFGRLHWLIRLIAGCAVLSLLLTLATTMGTVGWGVERIGGIIIVAQVALIIVFTPGLAGGTIAGELESGGWNLLRVTPLRAGRILRGKLLSVLITLLLVLCASLPGYGVMMVIKPVLREQVIQVLISLVLSAFLSLLVSATISAFFRSTAVATTVSYGVLLLIFAGTMIVWANQNAPFSHDFVQTVLSINPMAGALNVMQVAGFESFDLVPRTWWVACVTCVLLIGILQFRIWYLCKPD